MALLMAFGTECNAIPNFKTMFLKLSEVKHMVGMQTATSYPAFLASPIVPSHNCLAPFFIFQRVAGILRTAAPVGSTFAKLILALCNPLACPTAIFPTSCFQLAGWFENLLATNKTCQSDPTVAGVVTTLEGAILLSRANIFRAALVTNS